jgi:prepilin-type N-terminal cleavage/methylation domain-containing protein
LIPSIHPSFSRSGRRLLPADDSGFTLIEVLVATVLIAIGLVGLVTLNFTASHATTITRDREGATNLTREVVETIVSSRYQDLTPATVASTLQTNAALAPVTGYSGWTVLRRGTPYTLSVSGCNVDDPADGAGAHDASFCSGTTAGSADLQPIDYKRFAVTATWSSAGTPHTLTQTTLVAGKGTSEAPSITALTSGAGLTVTSSSTSSITFSATTSVAASGVAWSVEGTLKGLATGAGSNWSFTWDISSIPDGDYTVEAKAYNGSGTYGTPLSLDVTLNRAPSTPPQGFVAGWNRATSTVDAEWLDSPEPDTVGYTVYRQQTYPTLGAVTKVNCGTTSTPVYVNTDTTCTDASPIVPPSASIDKASYSSASTNDGTNTSSLTISKPAVGAGDFLVASIGMNATVGITSPAGWTLIRSGTHSSNLQLATFYKFATASEPATYTFTTADGSKRALAGSIVAYSGVNTSGPIDASGFTQGAGGNATSPSLTTTAANDLLIHSVVFTENSSGNTILFGNGLTERLERERSPLSHGLADTTQTTAGVTGSKSANPQSSTNGNISILMAVKAIGVGYNGIAVNYWVVPVDRDAAGNPREGGASNVVDAYAANRVPTAISSSLVCTKGADGSSNLSWTQPAQPGDPDSGDHISFDRIYRDGARFDRTGLATDNTWIDPNPGGNHRYWVTTVDMHLAESGPTGQVTC